MTPSTPQGRPANSPAQAGKSPAPPSAKPIKVPNPPEGEASTVAPETPKIGSRDAPGG